MCERLSKEMAVAALQLFEQAPVKLFYDELRDHVTATTRVGADACGLVIPDNKIFLALQDLLMLEIIKGYWAMARIWLEGFDIDNHREDVLSMIYILLGSASYTVGDLEELQRYVISWDRYTQTAVDIVKSVESSDYSYAVARVVEAGWLAQATELAGGVMPDDDEPAGEEFALRVAFIFSQIQDEIEVIDAMFS